MPRSPLFGFIARSMRLAAGSLDDPRATDELVELASARAISRRTFVSAVGAGAGALALSHCAPLRRTNKARGSVIVVGAGIAGLTAAYRLRQGGVTARVFEAQQRVGGRMYSLRGFFPDEQVAELGGELIDTGHTAIRALAHELDCTLDDLAIETPGIVSDVWFFGGMRRGEREVVDAFRPIATAIRRDLASLRVENVTYRSPGAAAAIDQMSIAQWLDREGVTGWVRDLFKVGYTTEYGLEIGEQSALNLLLLIDPAPDPFHIYGDSDERFHVRGGNDRIPTILGQRLGAQIETDTVLEAVTTRSDGALSCTFRRGATTFDATADDVVLAIPFSLLRNVRLDVELPEAKRRAIRELGYGTNAKLMVGFSDRVWRTRYRSNGSVLTDLPMQLTWETSRHQLGRSGILTNFVGGNRGVLIGLGSAADQAREFTEGMEQIFDGSLAARIEGREARFHWPTFPWTLGSYACYKPGQWTTFAGAEGESAGRLHFAGEHCSLDAQGYMEGGCASGEAIAHALLNGTGIERVSSTRSVGGVGYARGRPPTRLLERRTEAA